MLDSESLTRTRFRGICRLNRLKIFNLFLFIKIQAMNLSLPPDVVTTMTELRENPFAERILEVFSEDSR